MTKKESFSDNDYEQLKIAIISEINTVNAQTQFDLAQQDLLKQIKTLDTNDLFEIQHFYLTVLKWILSSKHILADQNKEIGIDDTLPYLIDKMKKNLSDIPLIAFEIINTIDKKYKPSREPWAQSHCYLLGVLTTIQQEIALKPLDELQHFLEEKKNQSIKENKQELVHEINHLIASLTMIKANYINSNNSNAFKNNLQDLISKPYPCIAKEPWWKKCIELITKIIQALFKTQPSTTKTSLYNNEIKDRLQKLLPDEASKNNITPNSP